MLIDFKIEQDEFGYYVVAYRFIGRTEIQYNNNKTMGNMLNLKPEEIGQYIHTMYNSEEKSKNGRMHFTDYFQAQQCVEGMRNLIPKAIRTNNLFLA